MSLAAVNPKLYQKQLDEKIQIIKEKLSQFGIPELEVFSSEPKHYRMRAEFNIWHDGDRSYYRMFNPETREPFEVITFPSGSERINHLMQPLIIAIQKQQILRHRLFQLEFLTTQSGEALISLIYHKILDDQWNKAASALQEQFNISIIGRYRKRKIILEKDYVTEVLTVESRNYYYQQVENSFTQPNAGVNEKMLTWASQCCRNNSDDLLELYCGNGNFTCVLAKHFKKVLATEISKTSVTSARENLRLNDAGNVDIVRLSSEELTKALEGERAFHRLRDINLKDYNFSTVFVDPPRSGLDKKTEEFIQRFPNILYISCNPDTLKANLDRLCKTHRIERIALFDQFPYTYHTEMGVCLVRIS
ncbi:MAG: tRNA (uridine(54)-C5)-methyltransferase TrmA [Candidatus Endonucleobacter bathymodioli]|uniref:tRNA/tmRNA (uracil-C(5))-methyltransferase n=1 Tax=Candidatus Endonucleibacter bathymodioli TaxID=539814 RepID=A0AA90NT30_9GAMM|nr:tRNA (uridine(54)-C5)-methyltransferase TrmA [Candidatus Endonucleobacter bathymodioli]